MKDKKNRKKNRNKTNGTSAYTEKMNQQPNGSKDLNAVLSKEVAGEKNEDNNVKTVSQETGKSEDAGNNSVSVTAPSDKNESTKAGKRVEQSLTETVAAPMKTDRVDNAPAMNMGVEGKTLTDHKENAESEKTMKPEGDVDGRFQPKSKAESLVDKEAESIDTADKSREPKEDDPSARKSSKQEEIRDKIEEIKRYNKRKEEEQDIIEMLSKDPIQRREARRKRRQRNQILAYSVVIGMIILLAVGIVFGIHTIQKISNEKNNKQERQQAMVDEILASEENFSFETLDNETSNEEQSISEESVTELTFEEKLDQVVNAAIEVMPLEDKIAGLFIVTPDELTGVKNATKAGDTTKEALSKYAVGGFVYRSGNIKKKETLQEMLTNTSLYARYPLFMAVEEEGGKETLLAKAKMGDETDTPEKIAETGDPANAYQTGAVIAGYLKEIGFNMNLAPVADLTTVEKSIMKGRSFGDDPQTVPDYVLNMAKGMQDQGIIPCIKHFPGLGGETTDTDKGLVVSERTLEEFDQNEFQVFRKLITEKVPVIMISNMSVPGITEDNTPACFSAKIVTDILRKDMEFDGLIITDALDEKAISEYHAADEAAIMALKAGCDMIVCPENFQVAYEGVLKAVSEGTISEARIDDALRRIYRIKFAERVEQSQADVHSDEAMNEEDSEVAGTDSHALEENAGNEENSSANVDDNDGNE